MPIEQVATSVGPGIFMQGPGGLAAVLLCERYGRYVNPRTINPSTPNSLPITHRKLNSCN